MAGIAYSQNHVAPQGRDARTDSYAQLREYVKGPRPELNVAAEDLRAGMSHGYEILSLEEAAAEVAEMNARADRDAQDRADRWGGGWDLDD